MNTLLMTESEALLAQAERRAARRQKKRRPAMKVSGKSVFQLRAAMSKPGRLRRR